MLTSTCIQQTSSVLPPTGLAFGDLVHDSLILPVTQTWSHLSLLSLFHFLILTHQLIQCDSQGIHNCCTWQILTRVYHRWKSRSEKCYYFLETVFQDLHTGEMTRTANLPVLPADREDFIGKVLVLLGTYSEAPSRHPLRIHWAERGHMFTPKAVTGNDNSDDHN